jgi:hypothetical protein
MHRPRRPAPARAAGVAAALLAVAVLPAAAAAQWGGGGGDWNGTSISVSGTPSTLRITGAPDASGMRQAVNTSTTLGLRTDSDSRVIRARLTSAPPAGVTIEVRLTPPVVYGNSVGTSPGYVALTTSAQVVLSRPPNGESTVPIAWRIRATSAAAATSLDSRSAAFSIEWP